MVKFIPLLGDEGIPTYPKCICSKMNVEARLELELPYYNIAVTTLAGGVYDNNTLRAGCSLQK